MSQALLIANGVFLLTVAFLPFPTAVVAEHLRHDSASAVAAFSALVNAVASLTYYLLARTVRAAPREPATLARNRRDSLLGTFWCLACAAFAAVSPLPSLLLVGALWLWWLRPHREAA